MNATDICYLIAGLIAVSAGLIHLSAHDPGRAEKITNPMFWFSITFVAFGLLFLFAESTHRA